MLSKLRKLGLCGLVIAALCGCGKNKDSPDEFKVNTGTGLHAYLRSHGGIKREANDIDFDGDGRNDFYVETEDGTIFTTHSSDYPPKELGNLFCPKFYKYKKEK